MPATLLRDPGAGHEEAFMRWLWQAQLVRVEAAMAAFG